MAAVHKMGLLTSTKALFWVWMVMLGIRKLRLGEPPCGQPCPLILICLGGKVRIWGRGKTLR